MRKADSIFRWRPEVLYKRNPQLNRNGELIHLLSTEGLPRDILTHILDTASNFVSVSDREVKKDRKSTRLNSSHERLSRMPSSA